MNLMLDVRSDTFSVPCEGMRRAIAQAEVGDDVFGEDPTVNRLEARTAGLLGKEAALFVPSGTMANGIGIRVLTSPGDMVLCGSLSHVYNFEGCQFALNSALQMHRLDELPDGLPGEGDIRKAIHGRENIHRGPVTLLALENTHNLMGGMVLPVSRVRNAVDGAGSVGVSAFLDGARLWHAHVQTGLSMTELAAPFSMVSVCFSKALGAPVGSVLAGSSEHIHRARWFRKRMGGGMRQAGILAAGCMYALDRNLPVLGRTHEYARVLARAFAANGRYAADADSIHTNIFFVKTEPGGSAQAVSRLQELGIGVLALDDCSIRVVTHLSLNPAAVETAAALIEKEL